VVAVTHQAIQQIRAGRPWKAMAFRAISSPGVQVGLFGNSFSSSWASVLVSTRSSEGSPRQRYPSGKRANTTAKQAAGM